MFGPASRRHGLVAYGAVIPSWWSATITNNAEGPKCTRLFPDLSIPGVPRLRRRSAIDRKTLKWICKLAFLRALRTKLKLLF